MVGGKWLWRMFDSTGSENALECGLELMCLSGGLLLCDQSADFEITVAISKAARGEVISQHIAPDAFRLTDQL